MAKYRIVNGENIQRNPTPFVGNLSGRFESREIGFNDGDVVDILAARETFEN
jgi:hypothetical protein